MGVSAIPQILFAKVMHARLFPKKNQFRYGIYYLAVPLSNLKSLPFAINKFGMLGFYERDHGAKDGSDLNLWAHEILKKYNIDKADGYITLVCMPRILGYVFNPVSFWICRDSQGQTRAVICEVRNTFGESHTYLCAHADQSPILETDVMQGDKVFHVSPFLNREGHYTFRFNTRDGQFGAWIDFYDADNQKQLITSLIGELKPLTKQSSRAAFWKYPLVTLKTIFLIHWQALKLITKGISYIPKPTQIMEKITSTNDLKEK